MLALPNRFTSLVTALLFALFAAAPTSAQDWRVDDVSRVVAISDVHGAYEAMVATLQSVEILDRDLNWIGGTAHLVIVGDILDRGPRSRDAMDLLMRIEVEAQEAGGYVHVLIGNHESMNMIGDMRYVSKGEYAAFAGDETEEQRERWFRAYQRRQSSESDPVVLRQKFDATFPPGYFALRKAFGADGKYGKWLLTKPIIAVINGTAFVHGGLSPVITEYGLDGVNVGMQSELQAYVRAIGTLIEREIILPTDDTYNYVDIVTDYMPALDEEPEILAAIDAVQKLDRSSLLASDGPLWYRANIGCGGIIERHRLDAALAALGAHRVVVGHTPTPTRRVLQRFDGRLIEVDTGMLNAYYKGSGNALVLFGDQVAVHNQSGGEPYVPQPHPRSVGMRPGDMTADELETLLLTGEIVSSETDRETRRTIVEVSDGKYVVSALFARRKGKEFAPDVAAYRLDRLLELDMVPVTVLREVNGREGSLQFFPAKTMNEETRKASGRGTGAVCPLPDQWGAMYVFDVLIYNEGRTEKRMLYDLFDWGIVLIEHDRAFKATRGRPAHLAKAPIEITEGWRSALQSLTDETLATTLDGLLNERRIRSLANRRDELLAL